MASGRCDHHEELAGTSDNTTAVDLLDRRPDRPTTVRG